MRRKKKVLSFLLVFSMIMGLFTGQVVVEKEAVAAGGDNNKIELGELVMENGSYTYPDVKITLDNQNQPLYKLSISVDSGYMKVPTTQIAGTDGTGIKVGSSGQNVTVDNLTTEDQFESVFFDIKSDGGATKTQIEDFIKSVLFTAEAGKTQTVSVSATGIKDAKTIVDGREYDLKYFNGHFYGLVSGGTWKESYRKAKAAEFGGVNGYLLTITSMAEDRFIWAAFGENGNAKQGWMGCTRAIPKNYDGDGKDSEDGSFWSELPPFRTDDLTKNVWRWVCGPEAGQEFGYQTNACGWQGSFVNDGGFETADGYFSNWNMKGTTEAREPNGGVIYPQSEGNNCNAEEGYGYYGETNGGNWNDHPDNTWHSAYIEFSAPAEGFTEDEKPIVIVTTTKGSDGQVVSTPTPKPVVKPTLAPGETATPKPTVKPTIKPTIRPTADPAKKVITGKPVIIPNKSDVRAGTTLKAEVEHGNVKPIDAVSSNSLAYQWYTQAVDESGNPLTDNDGNPVLEPIEGATDKTYTVQKETENKIYVVEVSGTGEYTGLLQSDPLAPIRGYVAIQSTDKDERGKDIVKIGTALEPYLDNMLPEESRDKISWEWRYQTGPDTYEYVDEYENKPFVVTEDMIGDKKSIELVVTAKEGSGYYGELESLSYDLSRTTVDIIVPPETSENGKRIIKINPTRTDTIYAIKDGDGNVLSPGTIVPTVYDKDNKKIDSDPYDSTDENYDPKYDGYYWGPENGTIEYEVDPEKTYIISEVKIKPTFEVETDYTVTPDIPDKSIEKDYDDKKTEDKGDDTWSITVDPADPDSKYAILEKVGEDSYIEVTVTKDSDGNYKADPEGTAVWSDGGDSKVTFSELDPEKTYKVVALPKASDDKITPNKVTGGSGDLEPPASPEDASKWNENKDKPATPSPSPAGNTPGASTAPNTPAAPAVSYTKEEEDKAAKFVKEHGTDPKGKIITKVTDLTRDIIVSGEAEWKKMTPGEKQAVNDKLKAGGCPYTFDELLKMAKKYKIPGFKVIKFMKKKSKAKLKLIKCGGATIACTSTNKKVATINKKGVISAKKPGRATLTFTAIKGKYTNRFVIDVRVKKKFKNAKELTKFKSKVIKTPTVLVAKKRLLKKSSKIQVYDLEKTSKVKFTPIKKKILTINKKGKYTGKKKGSTLVKVQINQNKKVYLLYVYVTIY